MSTVVEVVDSRALAGNPLGDPAGRRVAVWLPPSYAASPERRYPVIYWLAGYAGTGEQQFSGTPWQPGLGDRLDRLAASGAMGGAIVVAPDGFTRWGGAQYLDSPALGCIVGRPFWSFAQKPDDIPGHLEPGRGLRF